MMEALCFYQPATEPKYIFTKRKRAVRTASVVQVKDGLHSRSLKKWKHFEKHIQPMKEIIENKIIP